jgi:hypothetical protein
MNRFFVVNDGVIIGPVLLERICNISVEKHIDNISRMFMTNSTKKLLSAAMQ